MSLIFFPKQKSCPVPKVQEMLEMTTLCDGIILVGEAFSGKTTLYQVLLKICL